MASNHFSQRRLLEIRVADDHGGWTLDLSHSDLSRVPPAVFNMADLHALDLSDNARLKKLPREFQLLAKLKHLSMLRCNIEVFPEAICDMPSIESLRLSLNKLIRFPGTLSHMSNLKSLDLIMCSLTELPECLTTLPSLKMLDLKCNKLSFSSFPSEMSTMSSLIKLDLSNNELHRIPECLFGIPNLIVLKINHNRLQHLSTSIRDFRFLRELQVHHNQVQALPDELFDLATLEVLLIDNNKLKALSERICYLKHLTDIKESFSGSHNCLVTPPQSVCDQGLPAVREYFHSGDCSSNIE